MPALKPQKQHRDDGAEVKQPQKQQCSDGVKLLQAKGADGLKPSRVFTHSTHRLLLIQRTKLNPDELKEIALQGLVKKN